jgi:hypothetical protein
VRRIRRQFPGSAVCSSLQWLQGFAGEEHSPEISRLLRRGVFLVFGFLA